MFRRSVIPGTRGSIPWKSSQGSGFICLLSPLYMGQWLWDEGLNAMAAWRQAIAVSLEEADSAKLRSIAQSRTEPACRVERARILLAYREDPSFLRSGAGSACIIRRSALR